MTLSITGLTHHAESAGEALNRLRDAGIRARRISVQSNGGTRSSINAGLIADIPHLHREWLGLPAFLLALMVVQGGHAAWVGPAAVALTAVMLGCVAWGFVEQAAIERRRRRAAELVAADGVIITVHDVAGAEAAGIERLLHDSGSEAVAVTAQP